MKTGMRTGVKILLGCLATPFVIVAVLLVLVLVFRAAPLPESDTVRTDLEQAVPTVTSEQLAAEGLAVDAAVPAGDPMSVSVTLEEGNFRIEPGPPGSSIRVEGDYDQATYDLKQELTRDSSGKPTYTLSFLPRYSMLRRILSHGFVETDDNPNRLTIYLPEGVPMALTMQVRKGKSELQLGGLALQSATFDLEMGEHRLHVDRPNPIEMDNLQINSGMGEVRLDGVGNLRSGSIALFGKMGEVHLDMGRELLRDTTLFTRMRMGEMRVRLPRDARITGSTSAFLGEVHGSPGNGGDEEDDGRHTIDIRGSITIGQLDYNRY